MEAELLDLYVNMPALLRDDDDDFGRFSFQLFVCVIMTMYVKPVLPSQFMVVYSLLLPR